MFCVLNYVIRMKIYWQMSVSVCVCIVFNFKKKYKKKINCWGFYIKLKLFFNIKKNF